MQIFENGIEQLFGNVGNDVLVIVTAILVGVTFFYAWQTKRTVDSMEKATTYQFLPYLKASLESSGPTGLELQITNVGKGPAKDVEIRFYLKEAPNVKRKWNQDLLASDDFRKFLIPKNESEIAIEIDYFENNQTTVVINSACKDLLEHKYEKEETIDITYYVKQYQRTLSLYEEEPTNRIARNIEDIKKEAQKLANEISTIRRTMCNTSFIDAINYQASYAFKIIEDNSNLDTNVKQILKELMRYIIIELTARETSTSHNKIKDKLIEIRAINGEVYEKMLESIPHLRNYKLT